MANAGKPLVDYFTYRVLYEPCASLSTSAQAPNGTRPGWFGGGTNPGALLGQVGGIDLNTVAANRCQSLADKGLITGATTAQRADAALAKLQAYGWTDPTQRAARVALPRGRHVRRLGVCRRLRQVLGRRQPLRLQPGERRRARRASRRRWRPRRRRSSRTANGLGGNAGVDVIYNDSVGGAKQYLVGTSPSTGRVDGSLDGQLCLRNLVTGVDTVTGAPLTGTALANSQRVRAGLADVLLKGNLRGDAGADRRRPQRHAGAGEPRRARLRRASTRRSRAGSNVRYYEIVNGQHFDAFIPSLAGGAGINGYDVLFVPVHYYFINAMDIMWAKLKNNAPLPPSQVVRTTPRGGTPGAAPPITAANVPKIAATPAAANTISIGSGVINVPN